MQLQAERVAVRGPHGPLLADTSLRVATGQLALVAGEPGHGHTALALVLAGRLRPHSGRVLLDGADDPAALRAVAAVVDSPEVSAPEQALPLRAVVAEELTYAGQPGHRAAVRAWLSRHGVAEHAATRVDALPGTLRTRLLAELAAARPGVRVLVLDTPDRHTGDAAAWWSTGLRLAANGFAVVAVCTTGAARLLPIDTARIGELDQPAPLTVAPPPAARPVAAGTGHAAEEDS